MSVFDSILKSIGGAPDDVENLAKQVGIDPAMAEKAIAALGHAQLSLHDFVRQCRQRFVQRPAGAAQGSTGAVKDDELDRMPRNDGAERTIGAVEIAA